MPGQLLLEVVQGHRLLSLTHAVVEESAGQIVQFILVKVHPVLPHAGLDHLPEVSLLEVAVLVDVVDVEEELNLGVVVHHGELGHGLDELALGDVAAAVLEPERVLFL